MDVKEMFEKMKIGSDTSKFLDKMTKSSAELEKFAPDSAEGREYCLKFFEEMRGDISGMGSSNMLAWKKLEKPF